MPDTRTDLTTNGNTWEWWAEADEVVNLATGDRVMGQRVHYRLAGTRNWRTFLLTTSDGSMPTLELFIRALDFHGAS
jgi:hypothetical protein